jgi:hypothetical protein
MKKLMAVAFVLSSLTFGIGVFVGRRSVQEQQSKQLYTIQFYSPDGHPLSAISTIATLPGVREWHDISGQTPRYFTNAYSCKQGFRRATPQPGQNFGVSDGIPVIICEPNDYTAQ